MPLLNISTWVAPQQDCESGFTVLANELAVNWTGPGNGSGFQTFSGACANRVCPPNLAGWKSWYIMRYIYIYHDTPMDFGVVQHFSDKPRPASASRAASPQQDCRRAWCPPGRDVEATHMQISLGPEPLLMWRLSQWKWMKIGARTKALSIFPDRCAADLVHPPAIGGLPVSCVPWAIPPTLMKLFQGGGYPPK